MFIQYIQPHQLIASELIENKSQNLKRQLQRSYNAGCYKVSYNVHTTLVVTTSVTTLIQRWLLERQLQR